MPLTPSLRRFLQTWLALVIVGGLIYTSLRALATMIALGAPTYDWQWYVPLSACLLGLLLQLVWSWPSSRSRRWMYLALLTWLVIGFSPPGLQEDLLLEGTPPIAISFWAYTDFRQMPESVLQDLRTSHAILYLHAPTKSFDGDSGQQLASGIQRLAAHAIPVILMPPADDFLSTPVYRQWISRARLEAAFTRRYYLSNVQGLIGDAEAPLHTSLDFTGSHAAEVEEATHNLREFTTTLHHDYPNLQVGITAQWPLYFDGFDGDADLAIIGRSPVDPPGDWDFVNVMTYSSYWAPDQRPYWVASVIRGMAHRYPHRHSSHLIGLVGGGMPGEPLLSFDELVRDAQICRALGVREIVVFQLNGALTVFGADFVRRFNAAVNRPVSATAIPVPFARLVSLTHYGLAVSDVVLDSRGPRIWIVIAWTLLSAMVAGRRLVDMQRLVT
jgi:hypothetical protein